MSSSVFVSFYSKKTGKFLFEQVIDQLKYKLDDVEVGYSIKPQNIDKEPGEYLERRYIGLVKRDIEIPDEEVEQRDTNSILLKKDPALYDKYKKYKKLITEFEFGKLEKNKDSILKDYIEVHGYIKYTYHGNWFDANAFYEAAQKAEKSYEENYAKYLKLKELETSIEYFKLTEEQRQNYFDDLSCLKEGIEEEKYKMYALQYMVFLLGDFVKDKEGLKYDDEVVAYIYIA